MEKWNFWRNAMRHVAYYIFPIKYNNNTRLDEKFNSLGALAQLLQLIDCHKKETKTSISMFVSDAKMRLKIRQLAQLRTIFHSYDTDKRMLKGRVKNS